VVINQLRKKIESDPAQPKYIRTEPWVGYRFNHPLVNTTKSPSENKKTPEFCGSGKKCPGRGPRIL